MEIMIFPAQWKMEKDNGKKHEKRSKHCNPYEIYIYIYRKKCCLLPRLQNWAPILHAHHQTLPTAHRERLLLQTKESVENMGLQEVLKKKYPLFQSKYSGNSRAADWQTCQNSTLLEIKGHSTCWTSWDPVKFISSPPVVWESPGVSSSNTMPMKQGRQKAPLPKVPDAIHIDITPPKGRSWRLSWPINVGSFLDWQISLTTLFSWDVKWTTHFRFKPKSSSFRSQFLQCWAWVGPVASPHDPQEEEYRIRCRMTVAQRHDWSDLQATAVLPVCLLSRVNGCLCNQTRNPMDDRRPGLLASFSVFTSFPVMSSSLAAHIYYSPCRSHSPNCPMSISASQECKGAFRSFDMTCVKGKGNRTCPLRLAQVMMFTSEPSLITLELEFLEKPRSMWIASTCWHVLKHMKKLWCVSDRSIIKYRKSQPTRALNFGKNQQLP